MKRWSGFAVLLGGCTGAKVDMLLNGDADNDGYLDFTETADNTDPNDPADHPYEGDWSIDACRYDEPDAGTGNSAGDIAPNFDLEDQFGETVRLHDFCGKTIFIESAAHW